MYISLNQNYNENKKSEVIKNWGEEFLITSKRKNYLDNWLTVNEVTNLKIRRIIKDDNFIITFEHINNLSEIQRIKIDAFLNNASIELKPAFNEKTGKIELTYNNANASKKMDFEDINNINFEIHYLVNGRWYQTKRFTYWIKANKKPNEIVTNEKAVVRFLNEIEINTLPDRINGHVVYHDVNTKYVNIEFSPKKLIQGKHNDEIFDIKIYKTNTSDNSIEELNNSDIYDFKVAPLVLIDNEKAKYETKLHVKDFGKMTVMIDSYSRYDKYTNSVIIQNNSSKARQGILIPLNLKGDFGYTLSFDIGKNLKNFKLIYIQNIIKPFFGLNEGLIKMNTKSIKGWLTDEKWHTIKYKNFSNIIKSANSLEEIERMGNK
ncbi:MHO_1580 family protein [Mycoplasma enhydrae]|uniref:MHO_1580 family protein n=1 Tax=Mycoplasma enhydrae TaxID=2499220 RepID=UPI00197B9009|nr:hypothetical protein [Mycoplasma enhydrae]MBN4089512.1 hypothetical protein [Mycoplasma enhydrae]MCV3733643.1 hypothetical protein [Mycoplasma enhydrae]